MKAREVDLRLQKSLNCAPNPGTSLTALNSSVSVCRATALWQQGFLVTNWLHAEAQCKDTALQPLEHKRKSERELTLYCRAIFNTCHMLKREGDPRFTYSQGMTNPSCERGNLEPRQKEAPMPRRRNLAQVTGGQGSRKREPCQESL